MGLSTLRGNWLRLLHLLILATTAAPAWAQNLDIQHGRMAPASTGLTFTQGAEAQPTYSLVVAAELTYMHQPLRLFDAHGRALSAVVQDQVALIPYAAYGLLPDLELAASWLVVPYEGLQATYRAGQFVRRDAVAAGVGDVWLQGKYTLLHQGTGWVNLAVLLAVRVPVFSGHYFSDGDFGFNPEVLLSRSLGSFLLAGELGVVLRKPVQVDSLTLGQQLRWHAGVGYRFDALQLPQAELHAELFGLTNLGSSGQTPAEWYVGARYRVGDFVISAGGGRGMTSGYGAPVARGLAAVAWAPQVALMAPPVLSPTDSDHDGILDAHDSCADEPEDYLAPEPADGCEHISDRDGDGVADEDDPCPDQAKDPNSPTEGCPAAGVETDTDGDGIADAVDKCPQEPEDKPGPDADGCPDGDQDKDGIPDSLDQCPEKAEVINGILDEDGCPDEGEPELVEMHAETIDLKGSVFFGVGSDDLLRRAYRVLDQLAALLRNHRSVRIRVVGYTDASGSARVNMRLSKARAESVRHYLINKGINPERIETAAKGGSGKYGSNDDARGRALNRRVIITVIKGVKGSK